MLSVDVPMVKADILMKSVLRNISWNTQAVLTALLRVERP